MVVVRLLMLAVLISGVTACGMSTQTPGAALPPAANLPHNQPASSGAMLRELFFARPAGDRGIAIAYVMGSGAHAFTLPAGIASADWKQFYAATLHDHSTQLTMFESQTGLIRKTFAVEGRWALSSVSPTGEWLALTRLPSDQEQQTWSAEGRWETDIRLVDGSTGKVLHMLHLDGNFEVETISADGKSLFLVEHLPAINPEHYRIRLYDLSKEALVVDPVRSKGGDEFMAGYAWEGLASADGRWLLTLYLSTKRNTAFIHTLNLVDKSPVCIDLPSSGGDFDTLKYYTLALAPDGQTAYAANAITGTIAEISLTELKVVRTFSFDPGRSAALANVLIQTAHSLLSKDGTQLYFTSGQDVWRYDRQTHKVSGPFETPGQVAGLGLSSDGKRLYIAQSDGMILAFDTVTQAAIPWR